MRPDSLAAAGSTAAEHGAHRGALHLVRVGVRGRVRVRARARVGMRVRVGVRVRVSGER